MPARGGKRGAAAAGRGKGKGKGKGAAAAGLAPAGIGGAPPPPANAAAAPVTLNVTALPTPSNAAAGGGTGMVIESTTATTPAHTPSNAAASAAAAVAATAATTIPLSASAALMSPSRATSSAAATPTSSALSVGPLGSPSRTTSGIGRGGPIATAAVAAPGTAAASSLPVVAGAGAGGGKGPAGAGGVVERKTGGGRGRGRGGGQLTQKQKASRTAAAQREKEKEKEEAERMELLDQFEATGRADPIPNGVRAEAKWLDEQFHDSVIVKSRKVVGPQTYWLYYVHYPEFNKRMDTWVRRDRLKLPDQLSYHASAFAVTYPAAMPAHLIPSVLKEAGTVGSMATAATPASAADAAAAYAASAAAYSAEVAAIAANKSNSSTNSMDTTDSAAPAGASVSFAATNSVISIAGNDSAAIGPVATAAPRPISASAQAASNADSSSYSASMVDFGDSKSDSKSASSSSAAAAAASDGTAADTSSSAKGKAGKGKSKGKSKGKGGKGKNIDDMTGRKRKRSTGRMIHDGDKKINLIKNINTIQLGKYEMDVWYYAPFPREYNNYDKLYFCEFCLKFYGWDTELDRHLLKCKLRHPPGNEIYRSEEKNVTIAVFEIDGRKEVIYCQNLCYIAKMFLDDKLFDPEDDTYPFDTDPFLFYVLCEVDARGCHFVGYFSKAKVSEKNFNLACILTLPCHQRKGYGKFLISLSYELSKIEEKSGSPEKPLSDLGLVSYRSYWGQVLVDLLSTTTTDISIEQMSGITSITTDDILDTLKWMKVMRVDANTSEHVYDLKSTAALSVAAEPKKLAAKLAADPTRIDVRPCIAERLRWTPFIADPKKAKIH